MILFTLLESVFFKEFCVYIYFSDSQYITIHLGTAAKLAVFFYVCCELHPSQCDNP